MGYHDCLVNTRRMISHWYERSSHTRRPFHGKSPDMIFSLKRCPKHFRDWKWSSSCNAQCPPSPLHYVTGNCNYERPKWYYAVFSILAKTEIRVIVPLSTLILWVFFVSIFAINPMNNNLHLVSVYLIISIPLLVMILWRHGDDIVTSWWWYCDVMVIN
jgi:hypothetical protein